MITIHQLKLPCGCGPDAVRTKAAARLGIKPDADFDLRILRHSVDARKKPDLYDVYTVSVSGPAVDALSRKVMQDPDIKTGEQKRYSVPPGGTGVMRHRPLIIGAGPAGLFCALVLSMNGYRPVVIERGKQVEERVKDVEYSFLTGRVSASSNVQFGEGGAGTFSDGKLTTGVSDPEGRAGFILDCFVKHGAPDDILYEAYPHIGTDRLRSVLVGLRRTLSEYGCEFHFETMLSSLKMSGGRICGAGFDGLDDMPADVVVLAPGHSARDTFMYLNGLGIPMAAKDFAVGLRVVHEQSLIDRSQYGTDDIVKMRKLGLKPASYKLTYRCGSGRGAYTFCMCPGGYVVNAASMPDTAVVNGMSEYARDSGAANSAVVMTVSGADFGTDSILSGMLFQQRLEEKAFILGNSAIPVSDLGAFMSGKEPLFTERTRQLQKSIKGISREAVLSRLYGERLNADFAEAMKGFGKKIRGFDSSETLLAGPESRTSSPVRILRDEFFESPVKGLFPCGEGAGYAGGIMSAAMDGMKVAEEIIRRFSPPGEV